MTYDIQHNDIYLHNTQPKPLLMTLSIHYTVHTALMTFSTTKHNYYTECRVLMVVMLSFIMLKLNVIMLSVVAP